jgi:hypothetical protein|tara:strand:+ start:1786 stop:2076 length:291 start_codon:yes stop_codon:yes gene_type:complete
MPDQHPVHLFDRDITFSLNFNGESFRLRAKDLKQCFKEVFAHPQLWAKPIGGDHTIFDELPATSIDISKFTLNFIALAACTISENLDEEFSRDERE